MKTKTNIAAIFAVASFALLFQCQNVNASSITSEEMLSLINESRREAGVLPLSVNNNLSSAAEKKAKDMFDRQYFNHNGPDGLTPWDLIKDEGYDYRFAGENLAIGFVTSKKAHQALLESSSHRKNILSKNYNEVGIAVVSGVFYGVETTIIVEEFGSLDKKYNNQNKKKETGDTKRLLLYKKHNENNTKKTGKLDNALVLNQNKTNYINYALFAFENIKPLEKVYTDNIYFNKLDKYYDGDTMVLLYLKDYNYSCKANKYINFCFLVLQQNNFTKKIVL